MNDKEKDFLLKDDDDVVLKEQKETPALKKQRRIFNRNFKITAIVMFFVSLILIGFGLLWQRRYDFWAWSNAVWLAFAIEFFIAWIFFVYNKNILSPVIHGLKTFGLMIVGKRTKESYYEYSVRIEENPIPKYIYYTIFLYAFLLLIPALIMLFMQL